MHWATNCSLVREIGCSNVHRSVSRGRRAGWQPLSTASVPELTEAEQSESFSPAYGHLLREHAGLTRQELCKCMEKRSPR